MSRPSSPSHLEGLCPSPWDSQLSTLVEAGSGEAVTVITFPRLEGGKQGENGVRTFAKKRTLTRLLMTLRLSVPAPAAAIVQTTLPPADASRKWGRPLWRMHPLGHCLLETDRGRTGGLESYGSHPFEFSQKLTKWSGLCHPKAQSSQLRAA